MSTPLAMVLAVGRDGGSSAAGRGARRGARRLPRRGGRHAGGGHRQPGARLRGRPAQDAGPDGHQRGRDLPRRPALRHPRAAPEVVARCFPTAAAWPGRTTFADLGARALRRRDAALPCRRRRPVGAALPDPGWARFRADGERHLYAPAIVKEIQVLSGARRATADDAEAAIDAALGPIARRSRGPAARPSPADELRIVAAPTPLRLDEVEDAPIHPAPLRGRGDEPRAPCPPRPTRR